MNNAMPKYEVKVGNDGERYAVFATEDDAERAAELGVFDIIEHVCFGGYMNALKLK